MRLVLIARTNEDREVLNHVMICRAINCCSFILKHFDCNDRDEHKNSYQLISLAHSFESTQRQLLPAMSERDANVIDMKLNSAWCM